MNSVRLQLAGMEDALARGQVLPLDAARMIEQACSRA